MTIFPGASSTFVPSFEGSGRLQVEFSRNPNSFALPQYAKIIPVTNNAGYYLKIDTAGAVRMPDLNGFRWPDGQDRPRGKAAGFDFLPYLTERFSFPFEVGQLAASQAVWDIIGSHARMQAQLAMTARVVSAASVLTTSANWSGNTGTATAIGGGIWSTSSTANNYIKKTLDAVKASILRSTRGVVQDADLMLVVDPVGAALIANSPEYKQYLVNHEQAIAALEMKPGSIWNRWGLLPFLYGLRVVVDDTVRMTSLEGATDAFAWPFSGIGGGLNTCALVLARLNGLMGVQNAPEFSTVSIFTKEDMTVETKDDVDNRRTEGRVVDDYDVVLTAPASGYFITNLGG